MLAMKGSLVPVKYGIPRLMKMAVSITATRMIGRLADLNTSTMIRKTRPIEIESTTPKS